MGLNIDVPRLLRFILGTIGCVILGRLYGWETGTAVFLLFIALIVTDDGG